MTINILSRSARAYVMQRREVSSNLGKVIFVLYYILYDISVNSF